MGLNDQHLAELEAVLLDNPEAGDMIKDTGGARKIRFQIGAKGKSGGARVIYVDFIRDECIHLLYAYPKSVQSDLTPAQKKVIHKMVKAIKEE